MRLLFMAIGDEILRGESREANAAVLARELSRFGLVLEEIRVIADGADALRAALDTLAGAPTFLVLSGGLGPTDDDLTREAVAEALGVPVEVDAAVEAAMAARYAGIGRTMTASNRRQARFPRGAKVLENPAGTAPGFAAGWPAASPDSLIVSFPGVPREFREMVDAHLPALLASVGFEASTKTEHTLRVFGMAESAIQDRLAAVAGYGEVHVRSLPRFPEIRLAISGVVDDAAGAAFAVSARAALGGKVFSQDPTETFAATVLARLRDRGWSLAVAESCTGGLVSHLITDVPGASQSLRGSVVAYANEAKTSALGVPAELIAEHGAVSEPVARAMAEGARARTGADVAVSTTGIAGPTGGTPAKPVGTLHVAVATAAGTQAWFRCIQGFDRERYKRLAAYFALSRIHRIL